MERPLTPEPGDGRAHERRAPPSDTMGFKIIPFEHTKEDVMSTPAKATAIPCLR